MNPIRFNGTFKFPNLSPADKTQVEKLVLKELDHYSSSGTESRKSPTTMIQWQNGDSFQIETHRHRKTLGWFKSDGETDLLDQAIKNSLQSENTARLLIRLEEQSNAAHENRTEIPKPAEIQFSYRR